MLHWDLRARVEYWVPSNYVTPTHKCPVFSTPKWPRSSPGLWNLLSTTGSLMSQKRMTIRDVPGTWQYFSMSFSLLLLPKHLFFQKTVSLKRNGNHGNVFLLIISYFFLTDSESFNQYVLGTWHMLIPRLSDIMDEYRWSLTKKWFIFCVTVWLKKK